MYELNIETIIRRIYLSLNWLKFVFCTKNWVEAKTAIFNKNEI